MHARVILPLLLHVSLAAITKDLVKSLPGFDGTMPTMYSGFLDADANGDRVLHYTFVESMNDPAKDPVFLWLNGGPGSSSLLGMFTENGPFMTSDATFAPDGKLLVTWNPYSWVKNASVIWLEAPAGVGFSYCKKGVPCSFSDTNQAVDNYAVLKKFFAGFPEFAKNDFYITGESYAGIYIPTLTDLIVSDKNTPLNLVGFMIGNPTFRWGTKEDTRAHAPPSVWTSEQVHVEFFHGHGQYSDVLYQNIMATCDFRGELSSSCHKLLDDMKSELGGYDTYNIYDQCKLAGDNYYRTMDEWASLSAFSDETSSVERPLHDAQRPPRSTGEPGGLLGYSCGAERGMNAWVNQDSVRAALNMPSTAEYPVWPGSHGWAHSWNRTVFDVVPLYQKFVKGGLRVLIFSGDTDGCIPYIGTEQWTRAMNFTEDAAWRPWTIDGGRQMAGYVQSYEHGAFSYVTVRGSGHMVPRFRPKEALELVNMFAQKKPWLPYHP